MEIVYLNSGRFMAEQPVREYMAGRLSQTDILCLQEAPDTIASISRALMQNFCCNVAEKDALTGKYYRLGLLTNTCIRVIQNETLLSDEEACGLVMATTMAVLGKEDYPLMIGNIHGIPYPGDKNDSPGRLKQSRGILDFFQKFPGPKIIGGDFNLNPDTKSIRMFEEAGYRNLVKLYDIDTTRNELAWKNWPGQEQKYADYLLVSPEINVCGFEVPKIAVSDHLPMILEFTA